MADYNSAYTGPEVDAALAKTEQIMEFVQVYSGSPVNTGIPMSSIPVNSTTGDKTGVYDIIYSGDTVDVDSAAGTPGLSRIWIGNEGQVSHGSGHSDMDTDNAYMNSADYDGTNFTATLHYHAWGSGTAVDSALYVHKIYRLQELV